MSTRAHFIAAVLALSAACGSKTTPTSPTTPSTPSTGGSCRTYPTLFTATTTAPTVTLSSTVTARFDVPTVQLTSDEAFTQSTGCTGSVHKVSTWASVADFISEVAVLPPLERRTKFEVSAVLCDGSRSTSTGTLSYDGQRRLAQWSVQVSSSTPSTTTYTNSAWDGVGRPIATNVAIAMSGQTSAYAVSSVFNDTARTETRTSVFPGLAPIVEVWTYDQIGELVGDAVPSTSTVMAGTVGATAQVCK